MLYHLESHKQPADTDKEQVEFSLNDKARGSETSSRHWAVSDHHQMRLKALRWHIQPTGPQWATHGAGGILTSSRL